MKLPEALKSKILMNYQLYLSVTEDNWILPTQALKCVLHPTFFTLLSSSSWSFQ